MTVTPDLDPRLVHSALDFAYYALRQTDANTTEVTSSTVYDGSELVAASADYVGVTVDADVATLRGLVVPITDIEAALRVRGVLMFRGSTEVMIGLGDRRQFPIGGGRFIEASGTGFVVTKISSQMTELNDVDLYGRLIGLEYVK